MTDGRSVLAPPAETWFLMAAMMDIHDVDVLVVGAGSAGSAVALALAGDGRRVMLVDKLERGTTGARWVNAIHRWCFER